MGGTSYFFPPNSDPIFSETPDRQYDQIENLYGRANAAAFTDVLVGRLLFTELVAQHVFRGRHRLRVVRRAGQRVAGRRGARVGRGSGHARHGGRDGEREGGNDSGQDAVGPMSVGPSR